MSRILIVEDNDKNMKLLRDVLQHLGHDTLEAASGEEGVALALSGRPQLILMDIQLRGIDGVEALRRLRRHPELDAVPVIAISASVMPDDREHIARSGFDDFLAKPISLTPFLAALSRALARSATQGPP